MNENPPTTARFVTVIAAKPLPVHSIPLDAQNRWQTFLASLEQTEKNFPATKKLSENSWLIDLHGGMPLLIDLLCHAKTATIPLNILFSNEKPDWITYQPVV